MFENAVLLYSSGFESFCTFSCGQWEKKEATAIGKEDKIDLFSWTENKIKAGSIMNVEHLKTSMDNHFRKVM